MERFINLSGEELKAQEEIENMCMTKGLEGNLEVAETLMVLKTIVAEDHNTLFLEENTSSNIKQSRKMIK